MSSLAAERVHAWTAPIEVSSAGSSEASVPRVAVGQAGELYVVYQQKVDWRIFYRERSPARAWRPIEVISSVFSIRPDVLQDGSGRPHVVYPATNAGGKYDLVHAYKDAGVWNSAFLTNTGSYYEDEPRMAKDSLGRIHLVYTKGTAESSTGDVIYRMWNGVWSDEAILGHVVQAYYHRPDISVDSADNLHTVWIDAGGTKHALVYRKRSGGTWSNPLVVGQSDASASFLAYPKVAAATASNVLVAWHDDNSSSQPSITVYTYSNDGGASWATQRTLNQGHYPNLDAAGGNAYLVNTLMPSGRAIVYSKWNGSTWTTQQEQVTPASSYWKGWPDVAVDGTGNVHVVYDDVVNSSNWHQISYTSSIADTTPPGPVANFTAVARSMSVHLSWWNPADVDLKGTVVLFKTSGYPTGPTDGSLVCEHWSSPGSSDSCDHTGLTIGTTYYYSAFTYDQVDNYSTGVSASARPLGTADFDNDHDVDLEDFSYFQMCFNGPNRPPAFTGCAKADIDGDGDADLIDFAAFQACFNGPNRVPAPGCPAS